MLAVLYGLEKFHYYAYGRPVVVHTDHKPLEAIFKKHVATAPPRISRMMLRIQKYDVQIQYVPGKDVPVADALSRISSCHGDNVPGLDITVHEVLLNLNVSPTRVPQIQEETTKDTTLSVLSKIITEGWPERRAECPTYLHPYWNYRDELTVSNGLILKGSRIVIPKSLQPDVLQQLHYAHQGAEKCKLRAKGSVFWANINRDIEEMVKSCSPCQHHQTLNSKEPLLAHEVPPRPWHTLGSDIFHWNAADYLLVIDYYSKFPVIRKLLNMHASTVVANLKSIFEEYGIPSKMVTDNGTQYTASIFQEFSRAYGFAHVTSSPLYPQSNGLSERAVQTVKRLLQKSKESNLDPHLAMLCLRSTPLSHDLPSPAELLNSRTYQTNLPAVSSQFSSANGDLNAKLQNQQDQQKAPYDKSSKSLPRLPPQSHVRLFDPVNKVWQPGIIQSAASTTPRSYMVETEKGSVLRRNRKHLRPTGESFTVVQNQLDDSIEPDVCTTSDGTNEMSTSHDPVVTSTVNGSATPELRRSSRRNNGKMPERLNL